eukprot:m.16322 g.16322  ORF g.16322 m.16322 type:complete len:92 (-) comp4601_c0_seq1:75-350(-)
MFLFTLSFPLLLSSRKYHENSVDSEKSVERVRNIGNKSEDEEGKGHGDGHVHTRGRLVNDVGRRLLRKNSSNSSIASDSFSVGSDLSGNLR